MIGAQLPLRAFSTATPFALLGYVSVSGPGDPFARAVPDEEVLKHSWKVVPIDGNRILDAVLIASEHDDGRVRVDLDDDRAATK